MAPTPTRTLRIKARKLGATGVREMSRDELEEYIAEHSKSNGKKRGKVSKAVKAKPAKAEKKRGPGRPKGSKNRVRDEDDYEDEDEAPRKKRGRPKGSKNKTTKRGPGRPPKAESERKQARSTSRKRGAVGRPVGSGTGTRVSLSERINWNKDFDFRDGSTAQYILEVIRKSAKKYKDTSDIREDVFDKLVDKVGDVDELTFMNRETGKPHKGDKAEQRLRYYINRTMFDYANETDQHEGSGNGGGATVTKKKSTSKKSVKTGKRGPGRPRKVRDEDDEEDEDEDDEEEAPRKKRGRPKGSKNKTTVKKRGPGRPKGSKNKSKDEDDEDEDRPRRGRPKGSKNKTKNKVKTSSTKRGPGRPKGSKNRKKSRA